MKSINTLLPWELYVMYPSSNGLSICHYGQAASKMKNRIMMGCSYVNQSEQSNGYFCDGRHSSVVRA